MAKKREVLSASKSVGDANSLIFPLSSTIILNTQKKYNNNELKKPNNNDTEKPNKNAKKYNKKLP